MKTMNHGEYQAGLKSKSVAELRFIVRDAYQASQAMPGNPNVGYYLDEMCYAGMELKKRGL